MTKVFFDQLVVGFWPLAFSEERTVGFATIRWIW